MAERNVQKRVGTSISLSEPLLKRLNDFCDLNYHAERSAVVERAVEKFLDEMESPDLLQYKKGDNI